MISRLDFPFVLRICVLILCSTAGSLFAQSTEVQTVPETAVSPAVMQAHQRYAGGIESEWVFVQSMDFEATFTRGLRTYVYVYGYKGDLKKKKMIIPADNLSEVIRKHLPEGEILDVYEVLHRDKSKSTEVEMEQDGTKLRLNYDVTGTYLSEQRLGGLPGPGDEETIGFEDSELELIDDDIADLFEDDPLYNDDLAMEYDLSLEESEDLEAEEYEDMILEEEDLDSDPFHDLPD